MTMRFKKETRIEFFILTVCVVLAVFLMVYEVNNTISNMDRETNILVHETVRNISSIQTIHSQHLQLLRSRAEELLSEPFQDIESLKKRLVNIEGKGWELRPDKQDSLTAIGRLTGTGRVEDLSQNKIREIYTAEKPNNLFAATKVNLPNSPFVYYISASDFWNLTPRHQEEFAVFIQEYHNYDLYTFGLPENNPAGKVFWTKPYMDAGGNGLMVTAGIPIYAHGEFKGTICIDMLFKDIANYLKSNAFSNRNISLVDNYSQVVSSTFHDLAPPDKIPTLRNLINDERNNIRFFELNKFTGYKNHRIYISPIPNSQWYIFHFNTRSEFLTLIILRVLPKFVAAIFLLVIIYFLLYTNRLRIENEEARIKAEKANATKDKFFSIIAHDLRSPFTSLLGFSEIMNENFKSNNLEEQKETFEYIDKGIKDVYKLLENLLLWARLQKESITINPIELILSDLVNEAVEPLLQLSQNKAIEVINQIPADIIVLSDKSILSTVIRNIVSNAIKFTPKNGSINISAVNKNRFTEIIIKDNGIGIPPENINTLFNVSEKTSTHGTEGETGTGLGLVLCKEFVELQKGSIRVESEVGKGTSVYFTIPAKN